MLTRTKSCAACKSCSSLYRKAIFHFRRRMVENYQSINLTEIVANVGEALLPKDGNLSLTEVTFLLLSFFSNIQFLFNFSFLQVFRNVNYLKEKMFKRYLNFTVLCKPLAVAFNFMAGSVDDQSRMLHQFQVAARAVEVLQNLGTNKTDNDTYSTLQHSHGYATVSQDIEA